MTRLEELAKQRVLAVHPDARPVAWDDGNGGVGGYAIWANNDTKCLGEGRFEGAAWQNAAESLPAAPEQDDNDEESLLPCPFCGGTARWGESPDSGHFIECSKCQSSTNLTYYLMDDASRDVRERWNQRVK